MTRTLTFALSLALVLLPADVVAKGGKKGKKKKGAKNNAVIDPPAAVERVRKQIAEMQAGMAVYCMKNKLNEEGRGHLAAAKSFDPKNAKVVALAGKLDGDTTASDIRKKSYAAKLKKFDKKLASVKKALVATEMKAAQSGPVLRTASTHPMEYLVSLPSGWKRGKQYPVLVCVDGAGCNYLGCHRNFAKKKGKDFIVLTPISFWNTNKLNPAKYNYPAELVKKYDGGNRMQFDEEGLLAALKDVKEQFGGQDKFFITGFSGGGNLTWRMVFGHPDKVAAASPACGNFGNPGTVNTTAPERKTLPIKAFQGDKDQYLTSNNSKGISLNNEWAHAEKTCKANGFENVQRVMLPGVGHSSCAGKVVEYFREILAKSKSAPKKKKR